MVVSVACPNGERRQADDRARGQPTMDGNWHAATRQGTLRPDAVAAAYGYQTRSGSAFSFWTHPCLLGGAVSSGRSRVRANDIRTTRVTASRSYWLSSHGTSTQLVPGIVTQSSCIRYLYLHI
jgi:hypothetical protein